MNPFTGYGFKGEMLEAGDIASGEREQHILRPVVDSQPALLSAPHTAWGGRNALGRSVGEV